MKKLIVLFLAAIFFPVFGIMAQSNSSQAITYEELYDDPYAINKLFIRLEPLYAELFATNVNIGFGGGVNYYHKDKMDFHANIRQAYARSFDFVRDIALKNQELDNRPQSFGYYELGGTYHIKDFEDETETRIILYSKNYGKGNRWAAKVPEHTIIPSKVRKIIGGRLGGIAYNTSIDLDRILEDQELTLVDQDGAPIDENIYLYGNMRVRGLFLGGSMAWIKNLAIKPDKGYGVLADDLLMTTYFDFLLAPMNNIDDLQYKDASDNYKERVFSAKDVKTSFLGFRAGLDGKFNRELGWAYNIESGYRPGIKGRGFYMLFRVSFPVYTTDLDYEREAFGK